MQTWHIWQKWKIARFGNYFDMMKQQRPICRPVLSYFDAPRFSPVFFAVFGRTKFSPISGASSNFWVASVWRWVVSLCLAEKLAEDPLKGGSEFPGNKMFKYDKMVHIMMIAILRHINLQKRPQKALTIAQFVNSVQLINQFNVNVHQRVSSKITKIDFLEPVELMVFVC